MNIKGKLFLVDDETELLKFLKWGLEKRAYSVRTAPSGEEGLAGLLDEEADVLVADLKMPGMDGVELMQKALSALPDLQCIVLTGHGEVDSAIEAMRLGAVNYLRKPVGVDELEAAIEKGMDKIHLIRDVREKQAEIERKNRELLQERKKLYAANEELTRHRHHLEELLEEEMARRQKAEDDLARTRIRETLVEVMKLSLRYWEQTTGKTKIDLAEESRLWTVSMEKNGPRTRTLDKYLRLSALPADPRQNNVINTCYFVLKNCPDADPSLRERLQTGMERLDGMLGKYS